MVNAGEKIMDKFEAETEGEVEEKLADSKPKLWTQYLAVISVTIVSTVAGVNFAWPSPSIPRLLAGELPYNISKEAASYIAITAPVGNVVGGPISAILVDIIGRKNTLLLVFVPQILCFVLIYFSSAYLPLLYAARFLGGMGEGANFTVIAMYIGEVAHPSIRGKLGSAISLTLRTGILLVNVVGSYLTIRETAFVFFFFPVVFLVTFVWMPETPYYYLMKRKTNKARNSLRFLLQKDNVETELAKLTNDVQRQLSESGTLRDLFTIETNRRALLIGIGLRTFQQFSGISAFSLYTQILFAETADVIAPSTAANIYATIQLALTFVSSVVVDWTGRKPLLILSCVTCAVVLLLEGAYFAARDMAGADVTGVQWLPMAGMIVFIVVFCLGLGTVVNVMLGELFSASVKAKALGVLNVYFALTMTVTTKFFQYVNDNMGLAVPFFVFAGWCVAGAVFCCLCVPETKGKSLEEIQQILKAKDKRDS